VIPNGLPAGNHYVVVASAFPDTRLESQRNKRKKRR
jgi:hypothetical protein